MGSKVVVGFGITIVTGTADAGMMDFLGKKGWESKAGDQIGDWKRDFVLNTGLIGIDAF